jgi:surface polysaccharide O-acyltransferase-like enzyme
MYVCPHPHNNLLFLEGFGVGSIESLQLNYVCHLFECNSGEEKTTLWYEPYCFCGVQLLSKNFFWNTSKLVAMSLVVMIVVVSTTPTFFLHKYPSLPNNFYFVLFLVQLTNLLIIY